jgi:hypothetical protein
MDTIVVMCVYFGPKLLIASSENSGSRTSSVFRPSLYPSDKNMVDEFRNAASLAERAGDSSSSVLNRVVLRNSFSCSDLVDAEGRGSFKLDSEYNSTTVANSTASVASSSSSAGAGHTTGMPEMPPRQGSGKSYLGSLHEDEDEDEQLSRLKKDRSSNPPLSLTMKDESVQKESESAEKEPTGRTSPLPRYSPVSSSVSLSPPPSPPSTMPTDGHNQHFEPTINGEQLSPRPKRSQPDQEAANDEISCTNNRSSKEENYNDSSSSLGGLARMKKRMIESSLSDLSIFFEGDLLKGDVDDVVRDHRKDQIQK